ncbi:MAG: glycine betaine ABC transporter substrate-binding protein [Desulfitobacteriaceae bacterium]|nr:glycine betaine ABC transporter substrate-binding protein [Desulfitobacteriaceae bacterium]MDD4752946.1 glycine betaine ABC transporter substrate-binding protein [Desulfitobacteriaceae bacterium]
MKFKRICFITCIIILAVTLIGCPAQRSGDGGEGGQGGQEKGTITLGKVPFEQEWVPMQIIKTVAEQQGYKTEIKEGDVGVIFLGLSRGDIDIYPDVWLPTLHAGYMEQYKENVDLVGTIYQEAPTGWAVPTYIDIDLIEDLKGKSAEFGGRIIGVEPGAGMMDTSEKTIEEYDLDYQLLEGSTPAMLATVQKAVQNNEPVVFLAWRPHTMFQDFDIKLLKDTKDIWQYDDVRNGVNKGLKEKAPDIYNFLTNFKISIDKVEEIMAQMSDGEKIETLAENWVNENQAQIDEWLK